MVGVSLTPDLLEEEGRMHAREIANVLKSTGRLPADQNRLGYWDVNVYNNLQCQSVYAPVAALKHAGMLVYDIAKFVFGELLDDAFPDVDLLTAIAATDEQNLGWLARLVHIYKACRELSEFADDDDYEPTEDEDEQMEDEQRISVSLAQSSYVQSNESEHSDH